MKFRSSYVGAGLLLVAATLAFGSFSNGLVMAQTINKPSIQFFLQVHKGYKGDPETWSWTPQINFRTNGPFKAGDQLSVDDGVLFAIGVAPEEGRLAAAFARNDDLVGGGQRLAAEPRVHLALVGDAELDVVLNECIEDRIRDLVADLVGMSLGNGFAGKQIIRA